MTPRRGIISREESGAAGTLHGLENHDLIDGVHREEGTRMARMPGLTTTTARAPRTPPPLMLWRVARRRT